jgi:hypothetical protein
MERSEQAQQKKIVPVKRQQTEPVERKPNEVEANAPPEKGTYSDVGSGKSPATYGAGPFNYMPTNQNVHLRTETIGEPDDSVGGLEYLGAGYDILMGNPMGDLTGGLDPGFREPVIEHQFQYYHSWQEAQNQPCGYLGMTMECPIGLYVRRQYMCNHQETADEVSSTDELQAEYDKSAEMEVESSASRSESSATDVSAEGSGWGVSVEASYSESSSTSMTSEARFSGSSGFSAASSALSEGQKTFFDTTTKCSEYSIMYEKSYNPVVRQGFKDLILSLVNTTFVNCLGDAEPGSKEDAPDVKEAENHKKVHDALVAQAKKDIKEGHTPHDLSTNETQQPVSADETQPGKAVKHLVLLRDSRRNVELKLRMTLRNVIWHCMTST